MGIQGLLPLLKSIQLPITVAELSGSTVGVDAYCWLHKGAYGCALQLAEGKDSDVYINYIMRRVNMMLYYKVKPILVFDGGYLPSKSEKEAERRNKRKEYKTQGLAYLKNGNRTQALECFQKSIDITPEMAYNVIKACREKGVDCVVAPYEADAQLAYLMKAGITQFTISEDSDLLVYGCEKVIFKMDANGSGILINLKHLPKLAVLRMDGFTEKKFREMCILSGCDYLQSVKGMGLITAHKLLRKHSSVNKLISTLRLNNKMKVPKDYEEKFVQAEQTFLYQIVFDPNTNKLVPLNPLPDDLNAKELHFAGHHGRWKQEHAVQLALGNLNPITGEKFGAIRAAKVISLEKEEVDNHEEQRKTLTTPANRNKAPHSVLSSSKTYEAQKNLNGSVKETRSSEKTNAPFVTPVRTKRMRSEHEDNLSEGSKLARLYSTTNDEQPVRRRLEAVVSDEGDAYETESKRPEQPRKRPKNPFRSPVIAVKRRDGQVVSRYFGLAGMETIKEEPKNHDTVTQEDDLVSETPFTSPSSTDGSLPRQSLLNFSEHRETKLQESGYCCESIESSPTENSPNQSVHKNSTPLSSKASILAFAGTKSLSKCGISRNCENHEPPKKKIKSSQTSLEMFAFVRSSRANDIRTTKRITSPNRTVLGSISENCDCDEPNGEQVDITKEENVKAEDFTKILDIEQESEQRNAFDEIQGKSKAEDNTKHKTRTKNIVVRTKPKTGLGRCRSVGLSNRKSKEKKTSTTVGVPLLNFFAYRGRSSQSVTF